jgi:hypothetical protein
MARIALALAVLVVPLLSVPVAAEARGQGATTVAQEGRELTRTRFTLDGRRLPAPTPRTPRRTRSAPVPTPPVGTVREWLGLDDTKGAFYRKNYTLRGVGPHIEVWVAEDIAFPTGDCRERPRITDARVTGLVGEFDRTIYPKEVAAFSTPPDRTGANAMLLGDYSGAGEKTVTLIDNVRDANFYDLRKASTYTAGFFSAQLNELFDRNVMTIDAYDWVHRTGDDPPGNPTDDLCTSRPSRPRMYEATFAHEWQHLLQYYADPAEESWINEGLSDYAQTLVGYADATRTVYHRGFDPHLSCFQGWGTIRTAYNTNARPCGGPQNSLNLWNEGQPDDVLADYGNAYQFLLYLRDRFGPGVLTKLHRDKARQGLAGVTAALPAGQDTYQVIHDFQTSTLTDRIAGGLPSLRSSINLANPAAYDTPGAAPNGADYVRPRDAKGSFLTGADLRSVTFDGARTLPPLPLTWTVVGGALFSGDDNSLDTAAVTPVTVPARDPKLRFAARYGAETGYDFGYVTVSTDGGATYRAVAGDRTVTGSDGPAVTGTTDGFVAHTYDLKAYAGKSILLGFRYVTDGSISQGGWSIKDIRLGATPIPAVLSRFRSPTQIMPTTVHNWSVRLVGLADHRVRQVALDQWGQLADFDTVVAIVAYDEPTESVTQYAPYALTVNGVVQPGGRASTTP